MVLGRAGTLLQSDVHAVCSQGIYLCRAGGSTQAFAASVLPCVRSMASQNWAPAAALMPEKWTQLWQGQLSEESYRPAELHSAQDHAINSQEHSELLEEDEELIEE